MADHSATTSVLKHLKDCGNSGINSIRGYEVGELLKGYDPHQLWYDRMVRVYGTLRAV